tara:strand:+ start:739 stop:1290 length:552 start_codon:yes stop_codon:yes gene_type:complete
VEIDQMIAQAEKLSLEYDGDEPKLGRTPKQGCFRTALIDGGFAFKLSISKNGVACNRAEWDFYAMTTDEMREFLAKPRYISRNGKVVVFDCLTMREDVGKPFSQAAEDFKQRAYAFASELQKVMRRTHTVSMFDLHDGNFGVDDGTDQMVCTDFGHFAFYADHCDATDKRGYTKDRLYLHLSK